MALFGLGDIKFTKDGKGGPLAPLEKSEFSTTTLKYPLDVGATDKAHYMMIYIRKQKESQIKDDPESEPATMSPAPAPATAVNTPNPANARSVGGKLTNALTKIGNVVQRGFGKVENAIEKIGNNRPATSGSTQSTSTIMNRNVKTLRMSGGKLSSQTVKTSAVIALYMPDTLQFDFTQNYDGLSLTDYTSSPLLGVMGKILPMGIAGVAIAEQVQSGGNKTAALDAAKAAISKLSGQFGGIGRAMAFLGTGGVVNPMLEVIYTAPQFRPFQFNFKFYPRTEREGVEIQKIINLLQFHQAPELKANGSQTFIIPPSEFDIKFYYSGKENPNIPKIGSCVLKSIQLNYAPAGWAAYEVPGKPAEIGGTGMPVAIEMTLMFQETIYLTKHIDGVAPAVSAYYDDLRDTDGTELLPTSTAIETPSTGDIYR